MKKIILLLCALVLIVSCTKQAYYEIPLNADGSAYLTGISSTTTAGISTLDAGFSLTATFPNAKSGDVMHAELLQLQTPPGGGATKQLLPMAGTQKDVTVGSDLKATVTYTRAEAMLTKATEYVTVVFNGATDYAKARIDMVPATVVLSPRVSTPAGTALSLVKIIPVDVARTSETAYFWVTVRPKTAGYTYTLDVTRKNGVNEPEVAVVTSVFAHDTIAVPISGDDFAVDMDTMYYTFTAVSGAYTEVLTSKIIVRDPYFFLKKTAVLATGTTSDARNLINNSATQDTAAVTAAQVAIVVSVTNTLQLQGGSEWLAASANNTIEFFATTAAMYTLNNSSTAIAAFEAGKLAMETTTVADPNLVYFIYKATNGTDPEDVYYGLIKFTGTLPGISDTFEYRIGNMYAHLMIVQ